MKKTVPALFACLFAIGLLSVACDDALDFCTPNDALRCTERLSECQDGLDSESETYEADWAECSVELCECLDNKGCDAYIDEGECN